MTPLSHKSLDQIEGKNVDFYRTESRRQREFKAEHLHQPVNGIPFWLCFTANRMAIEMQFKEPLAIVSRLDLITLVDALRYYQQSIGQLQRANQLINDCIARLKIMTDSDLLDDSEGQK